MDAKHWLDMLTSHESLRRPVASLDGLIVLDLLNVRFGYERVELKEQYRFLKRLEQM